MNVSHELMDNLFAMTGLTGLFSITVEIVSILLLWLLLGEVKWDKLVRYPHNTRARMLRLLLAVCFGHVFAQFILQYWEYTSMLKSFAE